MLLYNAEGRDYMSEFKEWVLNALVIVAVVVFMANLIMGVL